MIRRNFLKAAVLALIAPTSLLVAKPVGNLFQEQVNDLSKWYADNHPKASTSNVELLYATRDYVKDVNGPTWSGKYNITNIYAIKHDLSKPVVLPVGLRHTNEYWKGGHAGMAMKDKFIPVFTWDSIEAHIAYEQSKGSHTAVTMLENFRSQGK